MRREVEFVKLKGVLIDFGNTLSYFDLEEGERYNKQVLSILRKHGYRENLETLKRHLIDAYRNTAQGEAKNIQEFWRLVLTKLDMTENLRLIQELEVYWKNNIVKSFKLYDGVIQTLTYLKTKYKLALVSNCSVGLAYIIQGMKLNGFFNSIILSYEVGIRKPNPSIYLQALHQLQLQPEDCIFVSDKINDLEGAKAVGLKTLLVLQGDSTYYEVKDPNFQADYTFDKISEINKVL